MSNWLTYVLIPSIHQHFETRFQILYYTIFNIWKWILHINNEQRLLLFLYKLSSCFLSICLDKRITSILLVIKWTILHRYNVETIKSYSKHSFLVEFSKYVYICSNLLNQQVSFKMQMTSFIVKCYVIMKCFSHINILYGFFFH